MTSRYRNSYPNLPVVLGGIADHRGGPMISEANWEGGLWKGDAFQSLERLPSVKPTDDPM